ncbi:hypothetical protein [Ornithinibacillus scapharcae]|uniref:hypothetical protein n=1 Tax=Ornithinibacillus scapharcae TaxID=1147159 RepID=UPI000225BD25|nr:hypothetical protein [Ornithinibacillus scapharcae]
MRSFLNFLLPEDEYKRNRIVYFIAEAAVIQSVVLFSLLLLSSWFDWGTLEGYSFVLFSTFFILIYTFTRYMLSGMEHVNVVTKEQLSKKQKGIVKQGLGVGFFFLVFMLIFEGMPNSLSGAIDIILPTIFFVLIYITFDTISLKRSYKKNIELLDE